MRKNMRMKDNCYSREFRCPFLKGPMFHSGFTGKSGEETWWACIRLKKYIRQVRFCPLAGKEEKQREEFDYFKEHRCLR